MAIRSKMLLMDWLRLVRWKNLLIVFFTQLLVWYCLIYNSADPLKLFIELRDWIPGSWTFEGTKPTFLEAFPNFLLISGSTILIAAAGYAINDYFDIKIDVINRPDKVILEKKIPLRLAILAHITLNTIALLMAGILAYKARHLEWLLIQVGCIVLLWFYSTHFKKQFISGNLTVAGLTTLTIIALLIYYGMFFFLSFPPFLADLSGKFFLNPLLVCGAYCFFAFMTTWMREIVKDMEDYKGDAAEGCITMPIRMGLRFSSQFIRVLGLLTLLALSTICYFLFAHSFVLLSVYVMLFILIPLGAWIAYLPTNATQGHYHNASRWLKIIMLSGIYSLVVYHFSTKY